MTGARWWTVFFVGTTAVVAIVVAVGHTPSTIGPVATWVALAVMLLAYLLIGRRALSDGRFGLPFSIILILGTGSAVAGSPNAAIFQAIAFPVLWSVIESVRWSVVANIALALSVAIGFLVCLGVNPGTVTQAATIESISLIGSLALGIWITRIADLSHERKRLLDDLTEAQGKLALLNRETGITSERERLAREIHDTIAQDLTALVMTTQRARRELGTGNTAAALEQLVLLEESARNALSETRALVASSAPVGLTSGITDALQRLAGRFTRETGVTVGVEMGDVPALDRDTEVVLLRIAQEGLANVRKHANAESAVVQLGTSPAGIALTVRDDGEGFDSAAPTTGFGLGGMRDRLALVGGSLDVASSPTGTALTATLPAPVSS